MIVRSGNVTPNPAVLCSHFLYKVLFHPTTQVRPLLHYMEIQYATARTNSPSNDPHAYFPTASISRAKSDQTGRNNRLPTRIIPRQNMAYRKHQARNTPTHGAPRKKHSLSAIPGSKHSFSGCLQIRPLSPRPQGPTSEGIRRLNDDSGGRVIFFLDHS